MFSILTDGSLWLNLTSGRRLVANKIFDDFIRQLQGIPSFQHIAIDAKWPELNIADLFLDQPQALQQFKAAVLHLGERVHSEE